MVITIIAAGGETGRGKVKKEAGDTPFYTHNRFNIALRYFYSTVVPQSCVK